MARRLSITSVESIRARLWPDFFVQDGCVYVGFQFRSEPNKPHGTLTEWELFANHTHLWDEFRCAACPAPDMTNVSVGEEVPIIIHEDHPEFILAKRLGETMALMWATKLKQDFPAGRFRVYYLHYDYACLRFHTVRPEEGVWLTDEEFLSKSEECFKDGILFDTDYLDRPVRRFDSGRPKREIRFGGLKGKIWVADGFDDPLSEEELARFEGGSVN